MGTEQQFCLRWNNHQSTLISVFDSLLENSVLVDCTLAADGQQLKAHKVVLSACSPYLETILSQHHDKHPIIILKDVKFAELRAMLEYMYRGEVNISQEQLGNFLKAAETLQIKGLTDSGGRGVANTSASADYKYKPQPPQTAPSNQNPDYFPVNRSVGLIDERKQPGLVIPSHVLPDRAPQSPLAAREGSVSPTLRKRRKLNINNYESSSLRSTAFPSSDTPDTTFPESLVQGSSQGSPSPPLSESASSSAAASRQDADCVRPTAVVKTELCHNTNSENEDSVTGDERSVNACDDERSNLNALSTTASAAGPSRHFISHGFGDKQHTLQDGSNDEFGPEDLQNSTQEVKLSHTILASRRAPPHLYAVHATNLLENKDKDKETAQSFPCDRCGKVYNRKGNLGRHMRYECGKGPQFPCHLCEKRFFRREKLAQHVRNHDMFQASALPLVWGQGRVSI